MESEWAEPSGSQSPQSRVWLGDRYTGDELCRTVGRGDQTYTVSAERLLARAALDQPAIGRWIVNTLPRPDSLRSVSRPPIPCTMRFARLSPSPMPGTLGSLVRMDR